MREIPPFVLGLLLLLAGCIPHSSDSTSTSTPTSALSAAGDNRSGPPRAGLAAGRLRLATTTSTRDSGLLDELLPVFEQRHDCQVDVVAVGTGAALRLGESGDADVLIVHAPDAEERFMAEGHGRRRESFMVNQFTMLGPGDDPAGIRGLDAIDALSKIAAGEHLFVSRGDDSGTHKRERLLWEKADLNPNWNGYLESGQGMGATLILADEKQAYTLCDEGTYLGFRDRIDLVPLTPASASLLNPYAVITVDPAKSKLVQAGLADALLEFLISTEAQRMIADYRVAGQQLFTPTRLPAGSLLARRRFVGRSLLVLFFRAAMGMPTVLIGLVGYALLSRRGPLGALDLLYTPWGVVAGEFALALPIVICWTHAAIGSLDPRAAETALTLGAGPWRRGVTYLSEARLSIILALLTAFARCFTELGVAMMVGGNIKFRTRTIATATALETARGEFARGVAMSLVLFVMALLVMALVGRLGAAEKRP